MESYNSLVSSRDELKQLTSSVSASTADVLCLILAGLEEAEGGEESKIFPCQPSLWPRLDLCVAPCCERAV